MTKFLLFLALVLTANVILTGSLTIHLIVNQYAHRQTVPYNITFVGQFACIKWSNQVFCPITNSDLCGSKINCFFWILTQFIQGILGGTVWLAFITFLLFTQYWIRKYHNLLVSHQQNEEAIARRVMRDRASWYNDVIGMASEIHRRTQPGPEHA